MLASHLPRIAVLREDVRRGRSESLFPYCRYQLITASVLRDYIEKEFLSHVATSSNLEQVIDDLVLLSCLAGNDFLPTCASLYIADGGMDVLFEAYKRHMSGGGGPLNRAGVVDTWALGMLCGGLAMQEKEFVEGREANIHAFRKEKVRCVAWNAMCR